jgi:hypothetical protein
VSKTAVPPKMPVEEKRPLSDERPVEALELAISEAQAAQWLLEEIEWGGLDRQLNDTETGGWLRSWAIDALRRTLSQGERAVRNLKRAEAAAVLKAAGKAVA